jgi:hypothetical protein
MFCVICGEDVELHVFMIASAGSPVGPVLETIAHDERF